MKEQTMIKHLFYRTKIEIYRIVKGEGKYVLMTQLDK